MERYVASYGKVRTAFVGAMELPDNANYLGADEEYYYYKANDEFYATTERNMEEAAANVKRGE